MFASAETHSSLCSAIQSLSRILGAKTPNLYEAATESTWRDFTAAAWASSAATLLSRRRSGTTGLDTACFTDTAAAAAAAATARRGCCLPSVRLPLPSAQRRA